MTKTYYISNKYRFHSYDTERIDEIFECDARPGTKAFARALAEFEAANGYANCTFNHYNDDRGCNTIKRSFKGIAY